MKSKRSRREKVLVSAVLLWAVVISEGVYFDEPFGILMGFFVLPAVAIIGAPLFLLTRSLYRHHDMPFPRWSWAGLPALVLGLVLTSIGRVSWGWTAIILSAVLMLWPPIVYQAHRYLASVRRRLLLTHLMTGLVPLLIVGFLGLQTSRWLAGQVLSAETRRMLNEYAPDNAWLDIRGAPPAAMRIDPPATWPDSLWVLVPDTVGVDPVTFVTGGRTAWTDSVQGEYVRAAVRRLRTPRVRNLWWSTAWCLLRDHVWQYAIHEDGRSTVVQLHRVTPERLRSQIRWSGIQLGRFTDSSIVGERFWLTELLGARLDASASLQEWDADSILLRRESSPWAALWGGREWVARSHSLAATPSQATTSLDAQTGAVEAQIRQAEMDAYNPVLASVMGMSDGTSSGSKLSSARVGHSVTRAWDEQPRNERREAAAMPDTGLWVPLEAHASITARLDGSAMDWSRVGTVGSIRPVTGHLAVGADWMTVLDHVTRWGSPGGVLAIMMMILAGLLCVPIFFVAVMIARYMSLAVSDLAAGNAAIAAGNLDVHIPVREDDELGRLAEGFNAMAASLAAHMRTAEASARMQGEIDAAARVQKALLAPPPTVPSWTLGARLESASECSGDLIDWHAHPDGSLDVLLADVCGHGLGAAITMAQLQGMFHSLATSNDLLDAVVRLNEMLFERSGADQYATLVWVRLSADGRALQYCNCGHPPPWIGKPGAWSRLTEGGVMAGAFPRAKYVAPTVAVAPGDWLVLLSDGILECEAPSGEMFDEARVTSALEAACTAEGEPVHVIATLLDAVAQWHGTAARDDDETLVVLRARG